ncbi:unnamed protein product [Tenebrio molitor]|nr:unnamed protein product [Tenebrio molitor]
MAASFANLEHLPLHFFQLWSLFDNNRGANIFFKSETFWSPPLKIVRQYEIKRYHEAKTEDTI